MKDREIDEIFERAVPYEVDPALLSRVSASITASLNPVRPMAPVWMLVSVLVAVVALVAVADARVLGFNGFHKLSVAAIATIFPALGVFAWLAATISVGELTPGGRRFMNPAMLLTMVVLGWIAVDALLLHDYEVGRFVPEGMVCLRAGVLAAIPAGGASWLLLRRGLAVDSASAGLAAGTLAGLAGLAMLELHCPNFQAPHVMVWHTAPVPVSAIAGALLARIGARLS